MALRSSYERSGMIFFTFWHLFEPSASTQRQWSSLSSNTEALWSHSGIILSDESESLLSPSSLLGLEWCAFYDPWLLSGTCIVWDTYCCMALTVRAARAAMNQRKIQWSGLSIITTMWSNVPIITVRVVGYQKQWRSASLGCETLSLW